MTRMRTRQAAEAGLGPMSSVPAAATVATPTATPIALLSPSPGSHSARQFSPSSDVATGQDGGPVEVVAGTPEGVAAMTFAKALKIVDEQREREVNLTCWIPILPLEANMNNSPQAVATSITGESSGGSLQKKGKELPTLPTTAAEEPLEMVTGLAPTTGLGKKGPAINQATRMAKDPNNPLAAGLLKKLKYKIERWMPQVQTHWTVDHEITAFAINEISRRIRAVPSFLAVRTGTVEVKQMIAGVQKALQRKRAQRVISDRKKAQARMLRH